VADSTQNTDDIRSFRYLTPARVHSGAGSRACVPEELERLGIQRAFVLTTNSLAGTTALAELEGALAGAHAHTFPGSREHAPADAVEAAVEAARACDADGVIAFGGGSVVDSAKVTALHAGPKGEPLPQIALPTTLSAGEFTPVAGVTTDGVKNGIAHARILPRVVVLDPELTRDTPEALWLTTGVKALDHALEALWSRRPHPVVDTLALEAVRRLVEWLPQSRAPGSTAARGECQIAAWMSISGMLNVGARLSHPLGHQIGARWGVPHGVTSCVVLPHVMRWLAPHTLAGQARIAEAFEVRGEGRDPADVAADAAKSLDTFLSLLGVPRRLRETTARRDEIPEVAKAVALELEGSGGSGDVPGGARDLERLLEAMW